MKKRTIWLVVSILMVLSLVLASCAPKVTEEKKEVVTEKKEVVTEKKGVVTRKTEGAEMVVDALGRSVPRPQYGGVLNFVDSSGPVRGFRVTDTMSSFARLDLRPVVEGLLMSDRLKGPAGSGEWTGLYTVHHPPELLVSHLAESWEIIPPDTLKFKIRKGIHWQDKAPTYGRELTADDVVYTFRLVWGTPGSRLRSTFAFISNLAKPAESIYLQSDDPRVVVLKSPPEAGQLALLWEMVASLLWIMPEGLGPIEEGKGYGTWQGVVGTGPFVLTDYVAGSSLTYERNPNYWAKDQLHPENRLPYLDGMKIFIIPDLSTQYAALRTGKVDIIRGVETEDAETLMRTNPELQWKEFWGSGYALNMRNDRAPFNDVRVRRAMMMAINYDEMVRDYYGGKAEKFWWPAFPIPEHKLGYLPLEQMPESVKELYGYHPDRAKKLLAEAGYPNGFTTSVLVSSAEEKNIDLASIVAAYWAKVGVTLKIDIKEPAVFAAMERAHTYEQGKFGSIAPNEYLKFTFSRPGLMNYAEISDPKIQETYLAQMAAYFDAAEVGRISQKAAPELISQAFHTRLPIPQAYAIWQPWVKGYNGEKEPSYMSDVTAVSNYIWIDRELRKAVGR